MIDDLVTYVKTNNAGLIVTHGTLSDWIIWTSPEGRIAVGARGNVGESIGDLNLVNERTVAALLGMPHLAFPEAIRDEVAQLLASLPPPDNVPGLLLGSVPLQVPFVPFDGEIQPTEQGRGHPILEGLGDDFTVSTPGLHQTLGLESVTQVGWQLAFPQVLARQAWEASRKASSTAHQMAGAVTTLVDQVVAETVATSNISSTREALEWALQALHTALTSACLGLTSLATTVDMPGIGKLETLLPLLDNLLSLIRVQVLATSPDLLAGIVAHDKDFVSDGYRSVYMSFEPEASMETTSETLLVNAVEWVKAWRYRDRLTLVGNAVWASKETAEAFTLTAAQMPGGQINEGNRLLNEGCIVEVPLSASGPGRIDLLVAHPTADAVTAIVTGEAEVSEVLSVGPKVTLIRIGVSGAGEVKLGLTAVGAELPLNPAHYSASFRAAPILPSTNPWALMVMGSLVVVLLTRTFARPQMPGGAWIIWRRISLKRRRRAQQ